MSESQYCHVVDVLRKFNPQLTEGSLDSGTYIGNADVEQIRARVESVCSEFEDETGRAFRLRREGVPNNPDTYEYPTHSAGKRNPLRVRLNGRDVLPLNPDEGDSLEVRVGRTSWRDVTGLEPRRYELENRTGRLTLYRRRLPTLWAGDGRHVRISYRHGALGGRRKSGGQTTLASSATDATTSLDVADAGRLPATGVLLIGNDEYVRLQSVDYDTDTLTVERGTRATTAAAHDADVPVHYCPERIRDAVAGRTAQELVRYDDWVEEIIETDADAVGAKEKIDGWQQEWEDTLARHSRVRSI